MKKLIAGLIRLYQICSKHMWRANCRFYPSCSEYTAQAVKYKGVLIGIFLGIKRILKCHPFHPGGDDPVVVPAAKTCGNGKMHT
ncbi:MAG: membrane protein insertion efficiency factor YidD [bacterium]